MKQQMRMRVDQTGEKCRPWKVENARSASVHIGGWPDGGDAVATDEHDPSFARLIRDTVENARRT
ncbi:MAG TPA: hypothetical protein VJ650_13365 [Gemmatimonadaceae bacterium]|nr:hypothetical protein [Gemmatimonadaceae bacterium]